MTNAITRAMNKLEALRKATDWHPDTMKIFSEWERQLKELEMNETIQDLPQIKDLGKALAKRYKNADDELRTNRNLTGDQRIYLFAIKDICEIELAIFSKETIEKVAKQIERDIDYEAAPFKK